MNTSAVSAMVLGWCTPPSKELDCPDCKGEGTVDQDMHDEQVQYVDNYYETACREALELHWEEVAEDRCRYA